VQFGDLLTLDVDGTIGGEQTINSQGIDFIPQPDNPLPVPGFSVHLEGMSEGQAKGFALTIPEDHHQAQYAGQQCDLQVKVLSIKEKKLPELDDEFAKGIRDGYESLEALGNSVRQQLTETSENASLRQLEQDILEELLKISTIQASDLIYQRERDHLYEERERTVRSRRIDMDAYLSYLGTTDEDWREQLKPEADRRLETYLVLRKLAQQEDIDVDQGELQAEIDSMVAASGDSGESMRGILSSDNVQDSIRSSLLSRKVMARLVEIVEGRLEATGPTGDAEEQPGEDDGSSGPEEAADAPSPDQEGIEEGADPDAE
jgi:trigger factor